MGNRPVCETPQVPDTVRQPLQRQSARNSGRVEVGKSKESEKAWQAQVALILVVGGFSMIKIEVSRLLDRWEDI
jgi:hypothetical protein